MVVIIICHLPWHWCFQTVVLEKTLESPLGSKETKPVNSKVNLPWILMGNTDAEAKTPILWPPDVKSQLIGKDPDAGKDWRQEKGVTGWDGWMASLTQWTWVWTNSWRWWRTGKQGVLQPTGSQVLDMTERLNNSSSNVALLNNNNILLAPSPPLPIRLQIRHPRTSLQTKPSVGPHSRLNWALKWQFLIGVQR